jgi:D-glycero-alpha-D-manno-heptose 1-phosphate guanylyltransferase
VPGVKAIILAGGLGTRLGDLLGGLPKPMAPVNGKPFLEILIIMLKRWSIGEIILSVGHRSEVIEGYFGTGKDCGIKITYSREREPLGTGGAIAAAMKMHEDDRYLVMNGDSYFDLDFDSLRNFHELKAARATLALTWMKDAGRYGRVDVNERDEITGFREKQDAGEGCINGGVYILANSVSSIIPPGQVSFEREVLPELIGKGLYGSARNGFFMDIGIAEDYRTFCKLFHDAST